MWASLENLIGHGDNTWVLCGDFNEVRDPSERLNSVYIERRASWFNKFIDKMQLIEGPMGGRSSRGFAIMIWGDMSVLALERKISNHCPISLRDKVIDFGPKPIKVFDEWIDVEDVDQVINSAWIKKVGGWRLDCVFRLKLRTVKMALKKWSLETFGKLDSELAELQAAASGWEKLAESGDLTNNERIMWMNARREWLEKDKIKNNMAKQKARGEWKEDPIDIKEEACDHFKKLFKKRNSNIMNLSKSSQQFCPKQLTATQAATLEDNFTEKEIFEAVMECDSSKAPGPDGYILDGALIVNESIDYLNKAQKKSFIFKVDFEKAFDSLSWDFLMDVMERMGFGCRWRKWILACLKSASISVLVNGSPTNEFSLKRGVRQGDPLSPFLFIIAAEGLNILTKTAITNGFYKGVEIGASNCLVSHLQYADDTIFLGDWSRKKACNLMKLLRCFEDVSGLKINYHKSQLYGLGVIKEESERMASRFNCKSEPNSLWVKIISSIYGPSGMMSRAEITSPKGKSIVWINIVRAGWELDKIIGNFRSSFSRSIGDGSNTSFWNSPWLTEIPLKLKFPRLYHLEAEKEVTVRDRVGWENQQQKTFSWNWTRIPQGRNNGELTELINLFCNYSKSDRLEDTWTWRLAGDGLFYPKVLLLLIDDVTLHDSRPR
ncbi:uncharacterized protein [Rutidosis leptorrhynchoides]|uniref:uncharacterized protein n=1 Tax=Rutidosis leptorrhynchoides TaxID=125765 RepID=UPI003A99596A